MQVKITRIMNNNLKPHSLVEFETHYGGGVAYWYGSLPNIAQVYDVELEIEDVLIWNKTVVGVSKREFVVSYQNESLILQGEIERISPEGIIYLRLGESIITFETRESFSTLAQAYVKIHVKKAILYNINL